VFFEKKTGGGEKGLRKGKSGIWGKERRKKIYGDQGNFPQNTVNIGEKNTKNLGEPRKECRKKKEDRRRKKGNTMEGLIPTNHAGSGGGERELR